MEILQFIGPLFFYCFEWHIPILTLSAIFLFPLLYFLPWLDSCPIHSLFFPSPISLLPSLPQYDSYLTLSLLLTAVSRTRMRTLRCGLRYTLRPPLGASAAAADAPSRSDISHFVYPHLGFSLYPAVDTHHNTNQTIHLSAWIHFTDFCGKDRACTCHSFP